MDGKWLCITIYRWSLTKGHLWGTKYRGTLKSSRKMHIMRKLCMDFNFLHENKFIFLIHLFHRLFEVPVHYKIRFSWVLLLTLNCSSNTHPLFTLDFHSLLKPPEIKMIPLAFQNGLKHYLQFSCLSYYLPCFMLKVGKAKTHGTRIWEQSWVSLIIIKIFKYMLLLRTPLSRRGNLWAFIVSIRDKVRTEEMKVLKRGNHC